MVTRIGIGAMAALTTYLWVQSSTNTMACTNSSPAPSHTGAEAAGIAIVAGVVIGTVVLVEVHKSHHNVKGCVYAGPGGIEVQTLGDNPTSYTLSGDASHVKVGDVVRLHGSKLKKKKGDSGDQMFVVEKLSKDYGPCKAAIKTPTPAKS